MRKALCALLVSLLFCACATTTPQPPAAVTGSNAATIRGLYDSFAKGDVPAILGSFDPEIVWMVAENSPYADRNPYRGPRAVGEGLFMRLGQEWNNFGVKPEEVIDAGDTVVVLGRYSGTFKATGQPVDAQFAHVWTLRGGKVVRFQQYVDTAQFARVTLPK